MSVQRGRTRGREGESEERRRGDASREVGKGRGDKRRSETQLRGRGCCGPTDGRHADHAVVGAGSAHTLLAAAGQTARKGFLVLKQCHPLPFKHTPMSLSLSPLGLSTNGLADAPGVLSPIANNIHSDQSH